MRIRKTGLVLFWIGVVYMSAASWLAMWWVAAIWRDTPPEQFEGTIWAFGGPVFMTISLSVPVGILLYSRSVKDGVWHFIVFAMAGVLVSLSMLFPAILGYYPVLFGIAGGLIYVFFFATLWYWAKKRSMLDDSTKTAADFQLASYVFFLLTASVICSILGNPFSGLLFPDKVMQQNALSWHYAAGTKVVIYFVLGWLFSFLSQYMYYKRGHQPEGR